MKALLGVYTNAGRFACCVVLSVLSDNHCFNNGDAGMAMLESSNASISDNHFDHNKYGVRMSVGCSGNMVTNNTISNTTK